MPTQPRVTFVGNFDATGSDVQGFVYIINKKISLGAINAVSSCINYYVALNAQYQEQSKVIWFFLQKICNITNKADEKFPAVVTLINELKC